MIERLELSDHKLAEKVREVFIASYKVEAELLQVLNFPPLDRPLEYYSKSKSHFIGYRIDDDIAGVMELGLEKNQPVDIRSMVVNPQYFRQGIASKLLAYLFDNYSASNYVVETGAANGPAIALYEKFGFKPVKRWMTEIGIEKVAFEKRMD